MQVILSREITVTHKEVCSPETSILKTLAYFDLFHYPLLLSEIKQFSDQSTSDLLLKKGLEQLLNQKKIFRLNDFYSLQNDLLLAARRVQGNRRAEKLLPKAMKIGKFLSRFPYVRAIGISGSLSKNYADEKADIDFFIITKRNRLWIARTLMHIFKKFTFITGRQHFYCMNYYVDETTLEMEDKNIFAATEIKTLLPVSGKESLDCFFNANHWTDDFLPAYDYQSLQNDKPRGLPMKKLFEWTLNNRIGDRIDNLLMRVSTRRWKRKKQKGKRNEKGQTMGLITGKHFARSNPESFQEKLLTLYEEKLITLNLSNPKIVEMNQAFL